MDQIKTDWESTKAHGYNVRKDYLTTKTQYQSGIREWQPLKNHFALYPQIFDLSKNYPRNYPYALGCDTEDHSDSMFVLKTITLHNEHEQDHFFIQHFRIVELCEKKLSYVKLMQIAYNAGQFKAQNEVRKYRKEVMSYYDENKLSELETYI